MRKCVVSGIALLAVLSFALPTQVSAQDLFFGAGGTFPIGDYGGYADPGWMVDVGGGFPLGENGLYIFANGIIGANSHSNYEGDKTKLLGGFAGVEKVFAEPGEAGPFIFGQVGFLKHDDQSDDFPEYEVSDTGLAFGGGAGYAMPMGGLNGWILGRYLQGQIDGPDGNTTFFGVSVGVSIPLGGDGD